MFFFADAIFGTNRSPECSKKSRGAREEKATDREERSQAATVLYAATASCAPVVRRFLTRVRTPGATGGGIRRPSPGPVAPSPDHSPRCARSVVLGDRARDRAWVRGAAAGRPHGTGGRPPELESAPAHRPVSHDPPAVDHAHGVDVGRPLGGVRPIDTR